MKKMSFLLLGFVAIALLAASCGDRMPLTPTLTGDHSMTPTRAGLRGPATKPTTAVGPLVKIYFTDGGTDRAGGGPGTVREVNPNGTGLATLVPAAGVRPRGIVVDDINGHIYWNDFGDQSGNPGLTKRSGLDGSNVTTIINHGQNGINDIDLDIAAGKVYVSLSVSYAPFHGVRQANLNGTGLVNLFSTWPSGSPPGTFTGWFIDGLAVDPANGRLYYGDIGVLVPDGSPSGIVRADLNGTNSVSLVPHLNGRGRGIALDTAAGKMYFGQHNPASSGSGNIWQANLDGTGLQVVVPGLQRPRDLDLDLFAGKIYWVDEQTLKIQRANLNGSNVEDVVTGLTGPSSLALLFQRNQPPDCSNAAPSISEIWPPNHKMVNISITGVTDPDGDPVTVTVTGITQDEPLNGLGDGDTSPDGAISGPTAQVRAERAGTPKVPGNGRVYVISFTASDGKGGTCDGSVKVCVPHDQRPGHVCIDDGQNYNSTGN